jgi:hypothetical protein
MDGQVWNKQYGDTENRWNKKKWFDAQGLVKPPSNSPYKKFITWLKAQYDAVLPKGDDERAKAARKAKPFLTLNAAYYANQITDGLADDICEAEGKGTVEAYTDATYAQAKPQKQGQPYKHEISQLILSKIKASADWKSEVKERVAQVIKDGNGARNGNQAAQQWIRDYGEVERKKRTSQQFQQMWSQRQGAATRAFQTQQEPIFSTRQRGQRPSESDERAKQARKAKPFLTLNAAYYVHRLLKVWQMTSVKQKAKEQLKHTLMQHMLKQIHKGKANHINIRSHNSFSVRLKHQLIGRVK